MEEYILKLQELLEKTLKDLEAIKILGDKDWKSLRAHEAIFEISSSLKKATREYQQKKANELSKLSK